MTEEDAKTKTCCGPSHCGERSKFDGSIHCSGSACMAWRRQTVMIDRATNEPAIPGVTAIGQLEERYSAHGFCGLAGAPQ